jgi:hypothetical protein
MQLSCISEREEGQEIRAEENKKPPPGAREAFQKVLRLGLGLGFGGALQGTDGAGGETDLHAADTLGLEIHLEGSPGSDVGMATLVPGLGSAAREFTNATHTEILRY